MQFDNRIIDDLARAASGMLSTLGSVRAEFEAQFRSGIERLLKSYDLVTREEFEAVKAMAAHDGALIEETYNLLNAWLSIVPGNSAHNLRRLALL